ncbi:MAG: class I SAM-dependent methyltransferase [Ramlibacter sp.]
MMQPEQYDAWYGSPRGAWIGEQEYRLLRSLAEPRAGETLLDVGCGTGWFTRRFAADAAARAVGADLDLDMLRFARRHSPAGIDYLAADAQRLPFGDGSFDLVVSITALCFVRDEALAVAEMVRVARRRVVLGLLNRRSLLYLVKGRGGGQGAYRGARWHTLDQTRRLFDGLAARPTACGTAIATTAASRWSRGLEPHLLRWLPASGAFIAAAADVSRPPPTTTSTCRSATNSEPARRQAPCDAGIP